MVEGKPAERTLGASVPHDGVDHLAGDGLLQRQSSAESVDQVGESTEADNPCARLVGDHRLAGRHQQVVRANRRGIDPIDHHRVYRTFTGLRACSDQLRHVHRVATEQLVSESRRDSSRRLLQ